MTKQLNDTTLSEKRARTPMALESIDHPTYADLFLNVRDDIALHIVTVIEEAWRHGLIDQEKVNTYKSWRSRCTCKELADEFLSPVMERICDGEHKALKSFQKVLCSDRLNLARLAKIIEDKIWGKRNPDHTIVQSKSESDSGLTSRMNTPHTEICSETVWGDRQSPTQGVSDSNDYPVPSSDGLNLEMSDHNSSANTLESNDRAPSSQTASSQDEEEEETHPQTNLSSVPIPATAKSSQMKSCLEMGEQRTGIPTYEDTMMEKDQLLTEIETLRRQLSVEKKRYAELQEICNSLKEENKVLSKEIEELRVSQKITVL